MKNLEELLFKRKDFAINLERIISNSQDIKVISVNSEWGTGKTYFAERFKKFLENEKYCVLEYNAWKNDTTIDPMGSIVGSLSSQLKGKMNIEEQHLDKIVRISWDLVKNGVPLVIAALLRHYLGSGFELKNIKLEDLEKLFSEMAKEEIKSYEQKKELIEEFHKELTEIRTKIYEGKDKKIIIFVDELDRCRPDFSIEVLERIKHFFNIPGYTFVFFIYKEQMESSIGNIYGEKIGSEEYLKRFFDLELKLPSANVEEFLDLTFKSKIEELDVESQIMFDIFMKILNKYYKDISLRQCIKIVNKYIILLQTIEKDIEIPYLYSLPAFFCAHELPKKELFKDKKWFDSYNVEVDEIISGIDDRGLPQYDNILSNILSRYLEYNEMNMETSREKKNTRIKEKMFYYKLSSKKNRIDNLIKKWCRNKMEFSELIE